jgi:mercuric ion transport protein
MKDAILMRTGAVGAVIAAVCCATPLLVIALGALGWAGVAAYLDYVLLPALAVCIGLFSYGLYLRRQAAAGCTPETAETKDLRS